MKIAFLIMVASLLLTQGYARYDNRCIPECCNDFDGAYIGGTVGWAFHDRTWIDKDAWLNEFSDFVIIGSFSSINDGVELGGQLGYNVQCGCALVGLELDANWADIQRTSFNPDLEVSFSFKDDTKWFGSIRARAGIIANNLLFFATAGAAWADINHSWKMINTALPIVEIESGSVHNVHWGLALGAGFEWGFFNNFGVKLEVLYHKFPEHSGSFLSPKINREVNFGLLNDIWVARIGVNYRIRALFL